MNTPKIEIYQIYYNEATRQSLDPDFIPLDNTHGPKEWYEFYPMLQFLNTHELDDDTYYGFLSPKFFEKTGVCGKDLHQIIQRHAIDVDGNRVDVFLSSVGFNSLTYHQNVFYQGERNHPGFLSLMQLSLRKMGIFLDLKSMISTNYNSAFCNYVIAKKRYWQQWQKIANQFYALVENDQSEIGRMLRQNTNYMADPAPMRAFIQERFVSVVLAMDGYRTMPFGFETSKLNLDADNIFGLCHYFKTKYEQTRNMEDLLMYQKLKELVYFPW